MAAILLDTEIIKRVQNPKNKALVANGLDYESRLKVYTEPLFSNEIRTEYGHVELLRKMRSELHPNKYSSTLKYFSYPLPITSITRDILGDLYKVFDGRNANFQVQYPTASSEAAGNEVLATIDTRKYIEEVGKQVLKNKPNTFVVVDKDKDGKVYLHTLKNESILGIEMLDDTNVDYIVFNHSATQDAKLIAYYDSACYAVLSLIEGKYDVVSVEPHDLGYCPVRPFLGAPLSSGSFNRFAPLSNTLSDIERWTLDDVYIKYASLYGTYPIVEMAKPVCEDSDCVNGVVTRILSNGDQSEPIPCGTCSSSKLIGAGTVVQVDAATFRDEKDVSGMFRFISPDVKNLEFAEEKQDKRANVIKRNVTGVNFVMEKEAVNADQVRSIMEDRRKQLLYISFMLNNLCTWIKGTALRLSNIKFTNIHSNFGTEWFLLTESDVQLLFKDAKLNGMPESELDELYKLLIETKYKGNPKTVSRLIIENQLNPAPYSSLDECYNKVANRVMTLDDLGVKANFTKYIKKFERDNLSLSEFGADSIAAGTMTYAEKIEKIYNQLLKYFKDEQKSDDNAQQAEQ